MSLTSSFGYQNKTASTHQVTPVALSVVENYALVKDEPTDVTVTNKTCALDRAEVLSYMCTDLKQVTTAAEIRNPAPVRTGVQYTVKLDEVLTTTSTTDANYRVDEPVVAYLTIRHPKSGNITDALVGEVVTRLIGACQKADGTWRFGDLMRSALKPTAN